MGEDRAAAGGVAPERPTTPGAAPIATDVLLEFMFRLGQAYLASGEQTAQVELLLRRAASAYGMRRARVVTDPVMPARAPLRLEATRAICLPLSAADGPKRVRVVRLSRK